jgi:hypothetical protein
LKLKKINRCIFHIMDKKIKIIHID